MKTCTVCGEHQDDSAFEPQRRQCIVCRKAYQKVRRKAYYARTREESIRKAAEWRLENEKRRQENRKAEYARNREAAKESSRLYRKNNPDKVNAWSKNRIHAKRSAMPAWADKARIKAYYDVCAFFNEVNGFTKYHVDHIIPLRGKLVTGLHVHNNLQVLLAAVNRSKGRKYVVV